MDSASFFSAGLSLASFLASAVVAVSYFKEKYSQKGVITDALQTSKQALREAEAATATVETVRGSLVQEAIAKAGSAKAAAEAATQQTEALAESVSSINAKLAARSKAEASRLRAEARSARGSQAAYDPETDGEGESEAGDQAPGPARPAPARRARPTQEELFAAALAESAAASGGFPAQAAYAEAPAPDLAEVKRRDPAQIRLRRK